MLIGTYQHNIDAKGRLIVPAKFRSDLGEHFCVCKGLDGCLFLFPMSEWTSFVSSLKELPMNKENRNLTRFFLAGATEAEIDEQGRIVIPQHLREYAGLKGPSVITGASNRAELWSLENWQRVDSSIDSNDIEALFEQIDFHF